MYHGALANLGLSLDPLTQNSYALAGGNPISYIETDGHAVTPDGGGGGSYTPNPTSSTTGSTSGGSSGSTNVLGSVKNAVQEVQGFFGEGPKAEQAPDWMKAIIQTWDDLETVSATSRADRRTKDAAGERLASTTFGQVTGFADARRCDQGDTEGCAWTAAALIPFGLGKGLKGLTGVKASFVADKAKATADVAPTLVYRSGSRTFDNLTPRPGKDPAGLSTYDTPAGAAPGGGKVQVIDTTKLKCTVACPDPPPAGHVSIAPRDGGSIAEWAATRGTGRISPYTQDIMDALIDELRLPKP